MFGHKCDNVILDFGYLKTLENLNDDQLESEGDRLWAGANMFTADDHKSKLLQHNIVVLGCFRYLKEQLEKGVVRDTVDQEYTDLNEQIDYHRESLAFLERVKKHKEFKERVKKRNEMVSDFDVFIDPSKDYDKYVEGKVKTCTSEYSTALSNIELVRTDGGIVELTVEELSELCEHYCHLLQSPRKWMDGRLISCGDIGYSTKYGKLYNIYYKDVSYENKNER